MTDVNVQDQRTPVVPPPVSIFVTSGTNAGNNTGWVFLGSCASGSYVWIGSASTDWQVAANWSPARTLPAAGDVIVFDGNATPAPIITNVPTQTVAALRLINGISLTLNASAVTPPHTLTLAGATGSDLSVPAGTISDSRGRERVALVGDCWFNRNGQRPDDFPGWRPSIVGRGERCRHFQQRRVLYNLDRI